MFKSLFAFLLAVAALISGVTLPRGIENPNATETIETTAPIEPTEPEEPHNHNYIREVVEATCLEGGYTIYSCVCGETYRGEYTDISDHSYSDWIVVVEATCINNGIKKRVCSVCGDEDVRHSSTNIHTYEEVVVPPTCTSQGYTEHTCKYCGYTYKNKYTGKTEHIYCEWIPVNGNTCTEGGQETRTCNSCGNTEIRYASAKGHSFTNYVSNNDATCTDPGTKTAKCDHCSVTDTVTDKDSAKGHTYTEQVTVPTCTEKGYSTFVCSCGQSYKDKYQDAMGHKYTAAKTEPTCTQKGYTTHRCKCGASYVDSYVDAKGHTWRRWIVMESATCDKEGREERECKTCHATEDRPIPKKERPISNENADEIAALAVKYINELRKQEGACAATVMNVCTEYAEYRSVQMANNGYISHDLKDKRAAANTLQYGQYIDPSTYGQPGDPYYTVAGPEAVGTAYGSTVEEVAKCIADGVQASKSHWNYVGANSNAYISVGVHLEGRTWYVCIIVARVNLDENPKGF